jgi:hypothetical protein
MIKFGKYNKAFLVKLLILAPIWHDRCDKNTDFFLAFYPPSPTSQEVYSLLYLLYNSVVLFFGTIERTAEVSHDTT